MINSPACQRRMFSRIRNNKKSENCKRLTGWYITICPISIYPFYTVSYYIKWVTTSWRYSTRAVVFCLSVRLQNMCHKWEKTLRIMRVVKIFKIITPRPTPQSLKGLVSYNQKRERHWKREMERELSFTLIVIIWILPDKI